MENTSFMKVDEVAQELGISKAIPHKPLKIMKKNGII